MPVKMAALPIASSGSVPASTMIVRVRVLYFQRDAPAIEGGKGCAFWPNYIVPKGRFFEFYEAVAARLRCKGAGAGLTWTRSKFRTESRRSVSFDTSTKPDTPVSWGASEMGRGTTLRTREKVMDGSKKGLTKAAWSGGSHNESREPYPWPESSARPTRTTRHHTPSVRPSEWPRPLARVM